MLLKIVTNHLKLGSNTRFRLGSLFSSQYDDTPNRATMCTAKLENRSDDKYEMIYNLREMFMVHSISKIKLYQGGFTAIATPLAAAFEYANLIPDQTAMVIGCVGVITTGMLVTFSVLFKGTIGIIKYNEEEDLLKISTINFWGKRIDEIMPLQDWVPLSEIPSQFTSKFYFTAQRYSNKKTNKLFFTKGSILHKEKFEVLIGMHE